jgi:hypothetical protein
MPFRFSVFWRHVATLAVVAVGLALSGCSRHAHVFNVGSHATPTQRTPARSHAKKHPTNATAKSATRQPTKDTTASTWAGELD